MEELIEDILNKVFQYIISFPWNSTVRRQGEK